MLSSRLRTGPLPPRSDPLFERLEPGPSSRRRSTRPADWRDWSRCPALYAAVSAGVYRFPSAAWYAAVSSSVNARPARWCIRGADELEGGVPRGVWSSWSWPPLLFLAIDTRAPPRPPSPILRAAGAWAVRRPSWCREPARASRTSGSCGAGVRVGDSCGAMATTGGAPSGDRALRHKASAVVMMWFRVAVFAPC